MARRRVPKSAENLRSSAWIPAPLLPRLRDLHAVALEEGPRRAGDAGDRALILDGRAQVAQLGAGQVGLGLQDEEQRVLAELALPLLGLERLLGQVAPEPGHRERLLG